MVIITSYPTRANGIIVLVNSQTGFCADFYFHNFTKRKFLNLAHYFPYDVKLRLLAHSRSFLANQKARNAIVGAENLLKRHIRNRSTNQIAGNSLFSSEIILNPITFFPNILYPVNVNLNIPYPEILNRPSIELSSRLNFSLRSLAVLSNLRAIGKRESRDKERQSREEPGRETTEKLPARMAGIFCQSSVKATFGELASHFNTPWFGHFSLLFPMIAVARLS